METNILEENKLIAEFMTDEPEVLARDLQKAGTLESMQYQTSWEWLMPVVEKIEGVGASVLIGRFFCDIHYTDPINSKTDFEVRIASGVKMNAIHGAAVDFIQWYNQNKK